MRHILHVSKRLPAKAADPGWWPLSLTNANKATPGLFALNEIGDVVLWLGTVVDNLPIVGGYWTIMPTGISKSGDGNLD